MLGGINPVAMPFLNLPVRPSCSSIAESSESSPAACRPTPVTLHVYDLGVGREMQVLNTVLSRFGTGAFHCGVEVYGREWSFQYSNRGTGVFQVAPKGCKHHTYRESVSMGTTTLSEEEVGQLLGKLQRDWPARSYEVLTRNCCHNCNALCVALGVGPIPAWTTNLALAGATVRTAYEGVQEVMKPSSLTSGCMVTRSVDQKAQEFHICEGMYSC